MAERSVMTVPQKRNARSFHGRQTLDFHPYAECQAVCSERTSRRHAVRRKISPVDFIHGGPFLDVEKHHCALDHMAEVRSVAVEGTPNIFHDLPRFRLNSSRNDLIGA